MLEYVIVKFDKMIFQNINGILMNCNMLIKVLDNFRVSNVSAEYLPISLVVFDFRFGAHFTKADKSWCS